jgi:hypothetical protein
MPALRMKSASSTIAAMAPVASPTRSSQLEKSSQIRFPPLHR